MTDPSTAPTDPTDEDACWFRAAVDPVLDARPVPDAWDEVRDRATGAVTPALALSVTGRPVSPARRWFLAAAVVALLAAIGGVVVVTDRGGDDPTDLAVDGPDDGGPTGFYLPTALPDGWKVSSVQALSDDLLAEVCPCDRGTWRDGARTISVFRAAHALQEDTSTWEPWPGAPGGRRLADPDDNVQYRWEDGDAATVVVGNGFDDPDSADALAAAWVDTDLVGPDGWEQVERSTVGADVRVVHQAYGELSNDDLGLLVPFQLGPDLTFGAGLDPFALLAGDGREPVTLAGSARRLVRFDDGSPPGLAGRWPGGTTFQIGAGLGEGVTSDGVTEEQVLALAAAFTPASAEAWQRFVEQADTTGLRPDEVDALRQALIHPTIDGFVSRDGDALPGGGRPEGAEGGEPLLPPGTMPAGQTLPTSPGAPPATVEGFAVVTEPTRVRVRAGEAFTVAVRVTNPTAAPIDIRTCFPAGASWSLQRDGRDVGTGGSFRVDCGDGPNPVAPGATVTADAPGGQPFGFRAATDTTAPLGPGRYEAVIRLGGLEDPIRVPVTVTG